MPPLSVEGPGGEQNTLANRPLHYALEALAEMIFWGWSGIMTWFILLVSSRLWTEGAVGGWTRAPGAVTPRRLFVVFDDVLY